MVQNIGRKKKTVLVHLFLVQLSQELHGGLPTLLRCPGSPGCQDAWRHTLGWVKTKYSSGKIVAKCGKWMVWMFINQVLSC